MLNKWAWREAENSELDIVQSSLHFTGKDAESHTAAITLQNIWDQNEDLLTPTGQAERRVGNLSLVTLDLVKKKIW